MWSYMCLFAELDLDVIPEISVLCPYMMQNMVGILGPSTRPPAETYSRGQSLGGDAF